MKRNALAVVFLLCPLLALANMNGGLHINTGKLLLFLFCIGAVVITNLSLAILNMKWKKAAITVVNGIFSLPWVVLAVFAMKLHVLIGMIIALIAIAHFHLIKKSIA